MKTFGATVEQWADQIAATHLSGVLRDQAWIIPASQSIHILCVSTVFASVLLISLRMWRVGQSGRSVHQLVDTLVPWIYRALLILLFTGAVQTIAEPRRQFVTPAFWSKMVLIVIALIATAIFARSVRSHSAQCDIVAQRPVSSRLFALVWLAMWVGIIFCGRFIGYTWQQHA